MQQNYKPFTDRMIDHYEGGYGWNPKDPGGPTKYGITCYDLAEHRGEKMDSMARWAPIVKAMQRSEAEDIYQKKYADLIDFNELPTGIDCCVMDYAVNSGVRRALAVMSTLLGLEPPRTGMSKAILDRAKTVDPVKFVDAMCQERLHFMHQIRHGEAWNEFGHGWQSRVDDLQHYCVSLIHNVPADGPPTISDHPKVKHVAPKPKHKRTATTAAGGAAASHATGQHFTVTVIVFVLILGAGIFLGYHERKRIEALNLHVDLPSGVKPLLDKVGIHVG